MIISPWLASNQPESVEEQMNATQCSLNKIPFRNAQIVQKVFSDKNLAVMPREAEEEVDDLTE